MDNSQSYTINYYSKEELKNLLRLLASQNSMWTRSYVVSYVSGLDDIIVLENRLNMNAIDFRNVFSIYFGTKISMELETLLRAYIKSMTEVLSLLKRNYLSLSNNASSPNLVLEQNLKSATDNWNAIGIEIANFLASINPNWQAMQMETLILDHIEMTRDMMEQRLRRDYAYEVNQYDFIEYHSLLIADVISNGIIEMFY